MRRFVCSLLLLVVLVSVEMQAYAGNVTISGVTFSDTTTTKTIATGKKSDNDQYWYIKLTGNSNSKNNPSSTNIFGARVWVGSNRGSTYRLFKSTMKEPKKYDYYSDAGASQNKTVTLKGKKDDSSTSSYDLIIQGVFCP